MATTNDPTIRRPIRPRPLGLLVGAVVVTVAGSIFASLRSGPAAGDAGSTSRGTSSVARSDVGVGEAGSETGTAVEIPGVAESVGATGSLAQLDHNIAAWTKNVESNPRDFLSATNLAILYHARARLTADLGDHERALAAASLAIRIAPDQAQARALEASILYSLHDFHGAFDAADRLVADHPAQYGALATRADASIELGDLTAARADLARLAAEAPGPAVDIRLARLAFVSGDLAGAVGLARAARDAVVAEGDDAGFYDYALAEYERNLGLASAAGADYAAAIQVRETDIGALLGRARIEAFGGELDAAIATLRAAAAIAPTPEAEALLGDLLAARGLPGDAAAARAAFGTVRLTRTLSALAGVVYDRTLVRFELDHDGATRAIVDAARTALTDRDDAAGHDLLAWALYRTRDIDGAWIEIQAALAAGSADARTLYHAGAIAAARGDAAAAHDLLGRALALGPALDPVEVSEARRVLAGSASRARGG